MLYGFDVELCGFGRFRFEAYEICGFGWFRCGALWLWAFSFRISMVSMWSCVTLGVSVSGSFLKLGLQLKPPTSRRQRTKQKQSHGATVFVLWGQGLTSNARRHESIRFRLWWRALAWTWPVMPNQVVRSTTVLLRFQCGACHEWRMVFWWSVR